MKECKITHYDAEATIETVACFMDDASDAAICNTIRNAIMGSQGLELDELDMDADGEVISLDTVIVVVWIDSHGQKSVTILS